MALSPRLDLRQTQSLVMTPQLQQAIKLLQFSSLELAEYVETQLEQNPLLERHDNEAPDDRADPVDSDATQARVNGEPLSVDSAVEDESPSYAEEYLDAEIRENIFDYESSDQYWSADSFGSSGRLSRSGSFEDGDANPEELLSSEKTLQDHLVGQLTIEIDDPVDRFIGIHLIDMLDEAGYLTADASQIADLLGCSPERVEATIVRIQVFDPPGIFARSLAECLALQLQDRGTLDAPMRILLDNLEIVGRRDWSTLMRLCGVGAERIQQMVAQVRSLNPKPALTFDYAVAQPIIPDVIMRQHSNGSWLLELNSETLPRVLVNNHYYAQVSRNVRDRKEKQYVNECLQSANWLVKSLHQRATTILKVASEIVRQQQEFFVNGVQSLKPLVLRDIADAISMHESTVSRVTSNKYMATPRGIYELKYFFTHAVGNSAGGDCHSAESVRYRLKKMVEAESAVGVLSDDALAEALQKEGIDIARRTVAKYREALGIPSSVQRRRQKGEVL